MTDDYTVRLERVFQGPMDLLLHLVREQEVEIHEVEITKVIDGYLAYLDALRDLDIELAGEFLVTAATLMSIKSRSLLPREEVDLSDELDPRDELIQRLLEYRRFKETSDGLAWRQRERERLHPRGAFPELARDDEEVTLDLGDLTPWDLLGTFSRLLRETLANRPHKVKGDARPLRYYVSTLANAVRKAGRLSLRSLLLDFDEEPSRETLVGAFCALLELIKLGVVSAEQPDHHGEIEVVLSEDVAEDFDSVLDATRFDDELLSDEDAAAVGADERPGADTNGSAAPPPAATESEASDPEPDGADPDSGDPPRPDAAPFA